MKLVFLIVVSYMFAGQDAASSESSPEIIESLKKRAKVLSHELMTMRVEAAFESLEHVISEHEATNDELSSIACRWTREVSVSKTNVLNEFAQTLEHAQHSGYKAPAVKLCSILATINVVLYIDPMIQTNIQEDLTYHQDRLQSLEPTINSIITNYDVFNQYDNVVTGDNVSVETLEAYIATLEKLLTYYKDEVKSGFSTYINTLQIIVDQFEMRSLKQIQLAQQYLTNVSMHFQNCLTDNYGL